MADHAAFAVLATRGHSFDGTFEAVERHVAPAVADAQHLVVVVPAGVARFHGPHRCPSNWYRVVTFGQATGSKSGREFAKSGILAATSSAVQGCLLLR